MSDQLNDGKPVDSESVQDSSGSPSETDGASPEPQASEQPSAHVSPFEPAETEDFLGSQDRPPEDDRRTILSEDSDD